MLFRKKKGKKSKPEVEKNSLEHGTFTLKEYLAPEGAIIEPDYIQLGSGVFMRSYSVSHFPSSVFVGFLDGAANIGDVAISTHIMPIDDYEVEKELTLKITRLEAQRMIQEKQGNIHRLGELTRSIEDAWRLRDAVAMNEDKMFYVTVVITITANSLEELDQVSKLLEETLGGRSVQLRRNFLRQKEGLISTLPLNQNEMDRYRNFNLGATTALFPFTASNLVHHNGVYLGTNLSTNAPVIFDPFIGPPVMPNANINVFAMSGSGKSYLLKLLAARSALRGVRSVFIDPDGEYRALTEKVGGVIVDFRPDQEALINPFDLEEEEDEHGNTKVNLHEKLQDIKNLFNVMFTNNGGYRLSPEENAVLDRCIMSLYSKRQITSDPNSLYEPDPRPGYVGYRKKEMPTISETVEWLEEQGTEVGQRLATLLFPYRRGNPLGLFDGQSRVRLKDAVAIDFDISHLEEGIMKPLAMHVILNWIWEKFVKRNRHVRKLVVADEAWMYMYHEDSAMFLEKMSRRCRKRNTSFCVASQSFEEFTRSQQGKAVLTNASATVLLKQNETDIEYVQAQYHLSDGQRQFLESAHPGEALLKIGKNMLALRVDASPYEHEFVNTTPGGRPNA
ncbi:type IV secretory pathway VirB4 components-like protein [Caldalkalibacillus thermarum TA2.A1]|nr:ATP-binding protein [Caldalkalibacillus thermarum]EGL83773.1 type IV secretory pathway VirB4 components-like protein [Caldalkalibacillus thermarum TA2.A1]